MYSVCYAWSDSIASDQTAPQDQLDQDLYHHSDSLLVGEKNNTLFRIKEKTNKTEHVWLYVQIRGPGSTKYFSYFSMKYAVGLYGGWSRVAMVSCILRHRGVQLKLAYSWARPAILVAGKGRGGMFLFLLFLHFHSCSYFFPNPLFHLLYYLFYLLSPFLWETTQNDPQGLTCR